MEAEYKRIRHEATMLAGTPSDLVQRSSVYFHLYQHSQSNHTFPLLAAHGALWGSGHFARGLKVGRFLSNIAIGARHLKRHRMMALERFALAFKEINRRVCVETYASYHMTRLYGEHSAITDFVTPELCASLNRCHAANRKGVTLNDTEKKELFTAFFDWEQHNIVGPSVDVAVAEMNWPLVMWLALKPAIGFTYFDATKFLWFSDFSSKLERIEKGREAFELAAAAGWPKVEATIRNYGVMPKEFLHSPARYFENLKKSVVALPP